MQSQFQLYSDAFNPSHGHTHFCLHRSVCLAPEFLHRRHYLPLNSPYLESENADIWTHSHRVLGLLKTKNLWVVGFAVIILGWVLHGRPQKTGFFQILHCHFYHDTSDTSRTTMSPGHVLGQMQNQNTQCDLEERAQDVNDCDVEKYIYLSLIHIWRCRR